MTLTDDMIGKIASHESRATGDHDLFLLHGARLSPSRPDCGRTIIAAIPPAPGRTGLTLPALQHSRHVPPVLSEHVAPRFGDDVGERVERRRSRGIEVEVH